MMKIDIKFCDKECTTFGLTVIVRAVTFDCSHSRVKQKLCINWQISIYSTTKWCYIVLRSHATELP